MMKRIALLTLVLGMVCTVRGQIYEIVGEEVCWNPTGTAIDSSLTRYILLSTRTPENTAVLAYVDENGNVADVSGGGTFTPGFCGCCGGSGAGAGDDDDFLAVDLSDVTVTDPIWRTGKVAIGIADSTAYKLYVSGGFRFTPDSLYSIFDWQNSLDTAGTDYHSFFFAAPTTAGRKPTMTGGRNTVTIGSTGSMLLNYRLGVLAFTGKNPDDTDQLQRAFIEVVTSEAWSTNNQGTDMLFWATDTADVLPQIIVQMEGAGRVKLFQYLQFNDDNPVSLAGIDGNTNITRHPVSGTANPGSLLGIQSDGTGLEWKDSTAFAGGADLDWDFVTATETLSAPAYRDGKVLIGTPDALDQDTLHQLEVEGDFRIHPDDSVAVVTWMDGADNSEFLRKGLAVLGQTWSTGTVSNTNNLYVGTGDSLIGNRFTVGNIGFLGPDTAGATYTLKQYAGIEALADGLWTTSNRGTYLDFYVTPTGSTTPSQTITFQGDGRIELDAYDSFDDGIPDAFLGRDNTTNDITRHVPEGSAGGDKVLGTNSAGSALEWKDASGFSSTAALADTADVIRSDPSLNNYKFFGIAPGAVKVGKIIDHPTAFTNDKVAPGGVIDMQHIYGDAWPYRLAMIVSPDHLGNSLGGAYLYVADNPEGPWYDYDTVIDSFDVADFPSKPAGNPIFEHPTASDKGEFFDWYQGADGKVYLQGHSNGVGTGQSQWIAESDDGLNFTYLTYMDYPAEPEGNHSFSYAQIEYWNGNYISNCVFNDVNPIAYGRAYSQDGRNWRADPRKVYQRDPIHWGIDTIEILKTWKRHHINGVDWAVTAVRNPPGYGGEITAAYYALFPVSRDGRRVTGIGWKLLEGEVGEFDENGLEGTPISFRDIHGPNPDRVWLYYEGINSSDEGNVGCGYIDQSTAATEQAFAIDSTYATTLGIDDQGLPLPYGWAEYTAYEIYPTSTDLPLGIIDTFFNGGATGMTSTVSPYEAIKMTTQAASNRDANHIFKGFNLADVQSAAFTIEGVRVDSAADSFVFGFLRETGGVLAGNTVYVDAVAASTALIQYYDGSVNQIDSVRQWGQLAIEDRAQDKINLTMRVAKAPTMDNASENTLIQIWADDQIIHNVVANDMNEEFVYPYIRVSGNNVSAEYEKAALVIGMKYDHTFGGNTGGLSFPEADTGGGGSGISGLTEDYIPVATSATTIGNSIIEQASDDTGIGINVSPSNSAPLSVEATALSSAREYLAQFTVSDDTSSNLYIGNMTFTDNVFTPGIGGYTPNGVGLFMRGVIDPADDVLASNIFTIQGASYSGSITDPINATLASISSAKIMRVLSYNTEVFNIHADGAVELGASGPKIITGSGTPESNVTAPVGSMYLRTDGGANTTLYIKESGTGNTGWVAK